MLPQVADRIVWFDLDEVPIDVLPDDVLDLHCADQAHGVPALPARGPWTRLAERATFLGHCGGSPAAKAPREPAR